MLQKFRVFSDSIAQADACAIEVFICVKETGFVP